MALLVFDYMQEHNIDADVSFLFEDTKICKMSARMTLNKLEEFTKFPLIRLEPSPHVKPQQVLKESFMMLPEAFRIRAQRSTKTNRNRSYKRVFKCCQILKKDRVKEYFAQFAQDEIINLVGLKGHDKATHRRYRLRQLRDLNTFYRLHKTRTKKLHFYPLRDLDDEDIQIILDCFGFGETQSSGCSKCPIFCVNSAWKKKDPLTWERSIQYAQRFGLPFDLPKPKKGQKLGHYQRTLTLCSGDKKR